MERLAARIERLVGADGFERLAFDRSPLGELGVGDGPVWTWKRYAEQRPLPAGRPLLAVTDLGLGGHRAARAETARSWLEFADEVAAAGSRLVLLVPYPAARWPAVLRRSVAIVRWDRATSVRAAVEATAARPR